MARRGWEIPEREATPEDVYLNRRKFLKRTIGLSTAALLAGCGHETIFESFEAEETADELFPDELQPPDPAPDLSLYPASLNPRFATLDRPLTEESVAGSYNNFYEFTTGKDVVPFISKFTSDPWTVEVAGLVGKPKTYDFDALLRKMPLEERLYRHRCVEAWAMAVPWTGFPLKAFIDAVEPLSAARYVKMTTFFNPEEAPEQWNSPDWPWAYTEGLTMAEATNELTLLATGIYGHELPKQHGAPIRLVVPWKYGYKSIKSIVHIEFTRDQPATFWNTLVSHEYGFESNVNPNVHHPRWSQARERMLGTAEIRPTLLYNGYEEYMGHLYRLS